MSNVILQSELVGLLAIKLVKKVTGLIDEERMTPKEILLACFPLDDDTKDKAATEIPRESSPARHHSIEKHYSQSYPSPSPSYPRCTPSPCKKHSTNRVSVHITPARKSTLLISARKRRKLDELGRRLLSMTPARLQRLLEEQRRARLRAAGKELSK